MKEINRVIKYIAIVFACFLVVSIFAGIIRVLFAFTTYDSIKKEYDYTTVNELDVSRKVDTLVFDLRSVDLYIRTGEEFKVDTNNKYVKISVKNNKLLVKEDKHKLLQSDKSNLNIYVPEDYIFNDIDIDTGAGIIKIDKLTTRKLDLDLGAGSALIENLKVLDNTEIDTGAGKVTISESVLNNLDLDIGAGTVYLGADVLGKSNIDAGVGALVVKLLNNSDKYKIIANKGIGSFKINGDSVKDGSTYGEGSNTINISGGVGTIKVSFIDYEDEYLFTKTYTVISKVESNEENKYYVTLKEFQGEVDTVLIEDKNDELKVDFTYEFNFKGKSGNTIEDVFKNELVSFNKTDKTGLEQIN